MQYKIENISWQRMTKTRQSYYRSILFGKVDIDEAKITKGDSVTIANGYELTVKRMHHGAAGKTLVLDGSKLR